jgi:hypothetical protein
MGSASSKLAQFDVFALAATGALVVVLQYPGLEATGLVVVAPLSPSNGLPALDGLTPRIRFDDQDCLLLVYRLAAIRVEDLGVWRGSLANADYEITRAMDRLFHGT